MRWEAYGYKSRAKLATKIAKKLGAASLLLRFETLTHQTAPQLREVMIYSEDIVGTTILKINGQKYFDAAVCNKTFIPVPRQPNSNHNALPQRNNFKAPYQYPNKSQHYPQQTANYLNRLPFRGHHQRGAPFRGNRGTNLRFGARGYQSNSRAPAPGNYKSNADSRKKLDLSHSPPTSTDQPGARLLAFHNTWRAAPPGIYSITKKRLSVDLETPASNLKISHANYHQPERRSEPNYRKLNKNKSYLSSTLTTLLPVTHLFSSQANRRVPTHHQLEASEQIY